MQQRRLRLGDILDDYCPRERRITNHAVVAMIEEEVKQTRCTTCDADHEYKQARVPVRRKKDGAMLVADAAAPRVASAAHDIDDAVEDDLLPSDEFTDEPALNLVDATPAMHADAADDDADDADDGEAVDQSAGEEEGPVHRRLIRATLPRPDGPSQEWKEPDFTVRQPGGNNSRGSNFDGNRPGQRPGGGQSRGPRRARPQGGGQPQHPRFGADRSGGPSRQGSGQPQGHGGANRHGRPGPGQGQGNRGPQQQRPGGSGRKRGR